MGDNTNLQAAKNSKYDEFYTTYETIEKEVNHYIKHFNNKTVLCNCDDPFESNFSKFFLRNFNRLGLKRLICTSYHSSEVIGTQFSLFDTDNELIAPGQGYVLDIGKFCDIKGEIPEEFIDNYLKNTKIIKK